MRRPIVKGVLLVVAILFAVFAVVSFKINLSSKEIFKFGLSKVILDSALIVMIFIVGYFASRFISWFGEPSIEIGDTTILDGEYEWVSIFNTDAYAHLEVKVFFEVYVENKDRKNIRSSFLVKTESVSLGSISSGNGLSRSSTTHVQLPNGTLDEIKKLKSRSVEVELMVKVTSIHRFTNARGLAEKFVKVSSLILNKQTPTLPVQNFPPNTSVNTFSNTHTP